MPTNTLKDSKKINEASDISPDRFRWSDPKIPITHKVKAAITLAMLPVLIGLVFLLWPLIVLKMLWRAALTPNEKS